MKKIVIVCPSCQKKMKISDKTAKYKCPHCEMCIRDSILLISFQEWKTVFKK